MNIDHSLGLCNGIMLIVTRLTDHVLEVKIMCGNNVGTKVLVSQMLLQPFISKVIPFKFQMKQFLLMLLYAMTINKIQGQKLSHVGLFFRKHVFNYSQMCVALATVSNPRELKSLI